MKYTDEQRIEKIKEKTEKLLQYIADNSIAEDDVLNNETIRWTITTPLYNIGEHAYMLSDGNCSEPWAFWDDVHPKNNQRRRFEGGYQPKTPRVLNSYVR